MAQGPTMTTPATLSALLDTDPVLFDIRSTVHGPVGRLPLTEELLRHAPSGDLFGWSMDVGMGWKPEELNRQEFLILSTSDGRWVDGLNPRTAPTGKSTGTWPDGSEDRYVFASPTPGASTHPAARTPFAPR